MAERKHADIWVNAERVAALQLAALREHARLKALAKRRLTTLEEDDHLHTLDAIAQTATHEFHHNRLTIWDPNCLFCRVIQDDHAKAFAHGKADYHVKWEGERCLVCRLAKKDGDPAPPTSPEPEKVS